MTSQKEAPPAFPNLDAPSLLPMDKAIVELVRPVLAESGVVASKLTFDVAAHARKDKPYLLVRHQAPQGTGYLFAPGMYDFHRDLPEGRNRLTREEVEGYLRCGTMVRSKNRKWTYAAVVDIDPPKGDHTWEEKLAFLTEQWERVFALPRHLWPTMVVWSGNKSFHLYWAFVDLVAQVGAKDLVEDLQRALAHLLGGDPQLGHANARGRAPGYESKDRRQPVVYHDPEASWFSWKLLEAVKEEAERRGSPVPKHEPKTYQPREGEDFVAPEPGSEWDLVLANGGTRQDCPWCGGKRTLWVRPEEGRAYCHHADCKRGYFRDIDYSAKVRETDAALSALLKGDSPKAPTKAASSLEELLSEPSAPTKAKRRVVLLPTEAPTAPAVPLSEEDWVTADEQTWAAPHMALADQALADSQRGLSAKAPIYASTKEPPSSVDRGFPGETLSDDEVERLADELDLVVAGLRIPVCPRGVWRYAKGASEDKSTATRLSCRSWLCPSCGPRKKEAARLSHKARIASLMACDPEATWLVLRMTNAKAETRRNLKKAHALGIFAEVARTPEDVELLYLYPKGEGGPSKRLQGSLRKQGARWVEDWEAEIDWVWDHFNPTGWANMDDSLGGFSVEDHDIAGVLKRGDRGFNKSVSVLMNRLLGWDKTKDQPRAKKTGDQAPKRKTETDGFVSGVGPSAMRLRAAKKGLKLFVVPLSRKVDQRLVQETGGQPVLAILDELRGGVGEVTNTKTLTDEVEAYLEAILCGGM